MRSVNAINTHQFLFVISYQICSVEVRSVYHEHSPFVSHVCSLSLHSCCLHSHMHGLHACSHSHTQNFGMLPTRLQDRRRSSIPKTAEVTPKHQSEGNQYWEYPSQQMFYNAMKRKGHAPVEGEMSTIVGMHNAVNEKVCPLGGCSHDHVVKWHPRQCFNLIDKHSI